MRTKCKMSRGIDYYNKHHKELKKELDKILCIAELEEERWVLDVIRQLERAKKN